MTQRNQVGIIAVQLHIKKSYFINIGKKNNSIPYSLVSLKLFLS